MYERYALLMIIPHLSSLRNYLTSSIVKLCCLTVFLSLGACGGSATSDKSASGRGDLKVVTTFLPMTLFATAVAGDCATVTALIPPNLGPHDFQATPATASALSQAQVLVENGLDMEGFLEKLVSSADNANLVIINTSDGVKALESSESDHNGHNGHHGHLYHDNGEGNPHIWLDPVRAAQQVGNIRDGLVEADPGCASAYQRNAELYTQKLNDLNNDIAKQLQAYSGQSFVAFHDFAPYFAERYQLKASYIVDLPEMNPSPVDLQRVATQVRQSQLKALLSEPQEGNRSFNALAKDLGIKIVEFDPLETGSLESSFDPNTYFKVMSSNVTSLIHAIGG